MRIAISPCPNDTYLFHAWIEGHVGKELPIEPFFADIQQLNELASTQAFPLIKLSFPSFAKVSESYQLLPIGSALGFDAGPKLIAKNHFPISELHTKRVALPGKGTTAHLLFTRLFEEPKEKFFCLYHEIGALIENGVVECGVIIHESRFTFEKSGFVEIADLGKLWHTRTQTPLPLGGIAISRSLSHSTKETILSILCDSLAFARKYPEKSLPFILKHSQVKDESIVKKHIDTYVTSETAKLSASGIKALETLLDSLPRDWLFSHSYAEKNSSRFCASWGS